MDATPFLYEKASGALLCSDCHSEFKLASAYKNTRAKEYQPFDQISSHLQLVHKMKKPAQGKVFKGWVTTDGKNTWLPHFAKSRDPDPTFETYEPVIFEKTRGNKDCPCPCYCDNTTPTNIHLQVPSRRSTRTRYNFRGGRNDRARSPSPYNLIS